MIRRTARPGPRTALGMPLVTSRDASPRPSSRTQPPRRAGWRSRWRQLPLWGALAAAGGYGTSLVMERVQHGDLMPIHSISVRGVDGTRGDEVRAYANVAPGTPLFGLDLETIALQIKEHPFIAAATVRRVPPDGIEIDVVERSATAIVAADGLYLVDSAGTPFKRARAGDGLDLPVVTGLTQADFEPGTPPGLLLALAAIPQVGDTEHLAGRLSEVHVEEGRGLTLVFDSGLRAVLGRQDFPERLARLRETLRALDERGLQARLIHVNHARRPERVTVRLVSSTEMSAPKGT